MLGSDLSLEKRPASLTSATSDPPAQQNNSDDTKRLALLLLSQREWNSSETAMGWIGTHLRTSNEAGERFEP